MKLIVIFCVLVCCILMFFLKREYKVALMLVGTILFTLVNVPVIPLHSAKMLLPMSFLLSELGNLKALIHSAEKSVVWKLAGLALLSSILTIVTSPNLHNIDAVRIFIQSELFFKYFALLYAFWSYSSDNSIRPTLQLTFYAMIVLTLFAVLNYITKSADFVSIMTAGMENTGLGGSEGDDAGQFFADQDRFRVQAMFLNPFDYGYICVLMLLLHLYGYINKFESRSYFYIVALCCVFGIVFCGCRTNVFCCLIGISIFLLFAFRLKKSFRLSIGALLMFCVSYFFIPPFQDVIDNMLTVFDKSSNVSGSSLEMRSVQYAAVLYHIRDNIFFGCGYHYFQIDLGWGLGRQYLLDSRLQGLEGVTMSYLLERGFIGLMLYFLFYIMALASFLRNRKFASKATAFGISVLCVYVTFANMTGNLLSVYPTLLLLGYVFKVVDYNRLKSTISGG